MIQAGELRIGNLVSINNDLLVEANGITHKVNGVTKRFDSNFPDSDSVIGLDSLTSIRTYSQFNEFIEPISLTEENLLSIGFEKMPHFTVTNSIFKNIGRNRQISVGCVGTTNEMVFLSEVDDDKNPMSVTSVIVLRNYDYDGKTYLHQIQNIVSDLESKPKK